MSVESEMLVERRTVARRLQLWRMVAVALAVVAFFVALAKGGVEGRIHSDHIARVDISGMILDNAKQQKLLKTLKDDKNVKAVVLRINSPGGTTAGGEALYLRIRELSAKKPVVAVFGTVAASAAYMAGIAADHIVARGSSITGSVGVIVQWPDVSKLMGKLGIQMQELKSGKLKATPTPFKTASKEELVPMVELVDDTFKWFVGLVVKRRKIKTEQVPGLVDGRVYTGRQAVKLGLVDEIGGEDEAVKWLESQKQLEEGLPVIERAPEKTLIYNPLSSWASALGQALLHRFGLEQFALVLSYDGGLERKASTGLMSVWQLPAGRE